MSNLATRRQFLLAGGAGLFFSLILIVLLFLLTPALPGMAFLARARTGSSLSAILFLLALGFLAVAELPIVLFALVRMARRGLPALALNTTHFSYTLFPAVYGALGTLLTGERWWLWVMLFLSVVRLFSSAILIDPREMAERHAARVAVTVPPAARPTRPRHIEEIRGFVLDMDGVLYRGNTVREGAIPFIQYLNQARLPYLCLTNNASRTSEMYQEKLDRLGIPIKGEHVMGSAQATAEWLRARAVAGARVLPIGEAGLREELRQVGFTLVEQPPADYVVAGIDFGLTYEKLKQAALAIRGNAQFVGTNPDLTFPSEEGLLPGNGSTLAYLEAATGVKPVIIGKPSAAIMEVALAHLGLPAEQVAMVGDRLDTDILGGQNARLMTILVRGGVTSEAELAASPIQPDLVADDLGALLALIAPEYQANLANTTPSR